MYRINATQGEEGIPDTRRNIDRALGVSMAGLLTECGLVESAGLSWNFNVPGPWAS